MPPIPLSEPVELSRWVEAHGGVLDEGLAELRLTHVADVRDRVDPGTLVLCASPRFLAAARESAGVVLCAPGQHVRLDAGRRWYHDHALWVFAGVLAHATPELPTSAEIDETSVVGPGAVVEPGARIGPRCHVGPNAVIHGGVVLEADVVVGAGAVLGRPGFGFAVGPRGEPRRIPQLGGLRVGRFVEIGALCTVDAGTVRPTEIGSHTKLDAHVHVGHNVTLGSRCMVAAQVGFAGSVEVGDDVWVGGQAGFADHVKVGRGARVGAKSGVIADVAEGAVVAGFPNRPRAEWLRQHALLGRLKQGGSRA